MNAHLLLVWEAFPLPPAVWLKDQLHWDRPLTREPCPLESQLLTLMGTLCCLPWLFLLDAIGSFWHNYLFIYLPTVYWPQDGLEPRTRHQRAMTFALIVALSAYLALSFSLHTSFLWSFVDRVEQDLHHCQDDEYPTVPLPTSQRKTLVNHGWDHEVGTHFQPPQDGEVYQLAGTQNNTRIRGSH